MDITVLFNHRAKELSATVLHIFGMLIISKKRDSKKITISQAIDVKEN